MPALIQMSRLEAPVRLERNLPYATIERNLRYVTKERALAYPLDTSRTWNKQ